MGTSHQNEADVYINHRSATRLEVPPCATCERPTVAVVLRTSMVIYFRCLVCGCVWSVPKPRGEELERPPVR